MIRYSVTEIPLQNVEYVTMQPNPDKFPGGTAVFSNNTGDIV